MTTSCLGGVEGAGDPETGGGAAQAVEEGWAATETDPAGAPQTSENHLKVPPLIPVSQRRLVQLRLADCTAKKCFFKKR